MHVWVVHGPHAVGGASQIWISEQQLPSAHAPVGSSNTMFGWSHVPSPPAFPTPPSPVRVQLRLSPEKK
jgi:hypothetical protein